MVCVMPECQTTAGCRCLDTNRMLIASTNLVYDLGPVWQPIETAPKDMTELIGLCGHKDVRLIWYHAPSSRTRDWLDQRGKVVKPTHWMPLPEWPTTVNGGRQGE